MLEQTGRYFGKQLNWNFAWNVHNTINVQRVFARPSVYFSILINVHYIFYEISRLYGYLDCCCFRVILHDFIAAVILLLDQPWYAGNYFIFVNYTEVSRNY